MKSCGNMRPNLMCVILAAAVALTPGFLFAGATFVDYTTLPDTGAAGAPQLSLGGTIVTGSNNVTSSSNFSHRGLGVSGGNNDFSIDLGETITINYQKLVNNVTVTMYDIPSPGNVTYQFEPFNGVTNLGVFPIPSHVASLETKDLTALSGGLAFDRMRFSLTESAPFGLVLVDTSFDTVPEPATVVLTIVGGIFLAAAFARRGSSKRPRVLSNGKSTLLPR